MRSRRRIVLWSILALCLFGLFYAFLDWGGPAIVDHALRHPQKDELSFQFQRCDRQAGVERPASPTMTWDDARTLRIAATAEANCGASWLFGDYAIRGNTIVLEYQAIVPRAFLCDCAHQVTYRIRGISKKDYRVELTAQPEVYTMWMVGALVIALALVVVGLVVAYAAASFAAWRFDRSGPPAAGYDTRSVRKAAMFLAVLLAFSGAANLVLGYLAGSTTQSAQTNDAVNDATLKHLGRNAGRERADRDFAAGTPRWFVMEESEGVPANRPERTLAVMEGGGAAAFEPYGKAYVSGYNSRMDYHMPPPKPRGGPAKG